MNQELQALFGQDQNDRQQDLPAGRLLARDRLRRDKVDELIAAGALRVGADYYHAAMIFQHGTERRHYWRAHLLARRGAELGHAGARWLTAASYDRWLVAGGLPQRYGTQYQLLADRWVPLATDPGTTDAERAIWNVPPLARQAGGEMAGGEMAGSEGEDGAR